MLAPNWFVQRLANCVPYHVKVLLAATKAAQKQLKTPYARLFETVLQTPTYPCPKCAGTTSPAPLFETGSQNASTELIESARGKSPQER